MSVPFAKIEMRISQRNQTIRRLRSRIQDLTPAMEEGIAEAAKITAEEFTGSYWESPSGQRVPWAPRKNPKPKHPLLIKTGRLMRSMTIQGAEGNVWIVRARSFTLGSNIRGTKPPFEMYAAIQRGNSAAGGPFVSHAGITPRPFATRNPRLVAAVAAAIQAHILARRAARSK